MNDSRKDPAGGGVGGPPLRTDIVDVYVFREDPNGALDFLQLLRATEPLDNTWHPVMGHIEPGETAAQCALRELEEETSLAHAHPTFLGFWALEQTHPYYVPEIDCIVLSPRFAVHVSPEFVPTLDPDNADHRWIPLDEAPRQFMWPGQLAAVREIAAHIAPTNAPARERLRLDPARILAR